VVVEGKERVAGLETGSADAEQQERHQLSVSMVEAQAAVLVCPSPRMILYSAGSDSQLAAVEAVLSPLSPSSPPLQPV